MEKRNIFRPRFWITPTILSDDKRIEPFDEKVYAAVDWFHGMKDGECRASNATLAELIRPNDPQPRSVQNSLNRLEQCGYINRKYKDEAKRNRVRIVPLIELRVVRNGDDTQGTSEMAMIPVRIRDDRASESVMTRVRIRSNKRSKSIDTAPQGGAEVNKLIALFEPINPSFERLFANKTQRAAIDRLRKKHSAEKVEGAIKFAVSVYHTDFAPMITTPLQLETKLGQLVAFWGKENRKAPMLIEI